MFTAGIFIVFPLIDYARYRTGCAVPSRAPNSSKATLLNLPYNAAWRLNESVIVGLHNSYHQQSVSATLVTEWAFSHPSLDEQLRLGYREIEIDVHLSTDQSFRVFHITLLDEGSSCSCYVDCLNIIKKWTEANTNHTPIVIQLEPRGFNYNNMFCTDDVDSSTQAWAFRELRDITVEALGSKLLYPDEVIGSYKSLHEALTTGGWPKVGHLLGRIIVTINLFGSNEACRDRYLEAPGRRPFFTRASGISPEKMTNYSAFIEEGSPTTIRLANAQGMIVRHRIIAEKPEYGADFLARRTAFPATTFAYDLSPV